MQINSIVTWYKGCRIRKNVSYHAPYTHPDLSTINGVGFWITHPILELKRPKPPLGNETYMNIISTCACLKLFPLGLLGINISPKFFRNIFQIIFKDFFDKSLIVYLGG